MSKILQSTIAATMLAMVSSAVLADLPSGLSRADTFGDSLINLPIDESTVTTAAPDVWFLEINQAQYYSVDIVGAGKHGDISNACNDNPVNPDRVYEYRAILSAADIQCGLETTNTKPGDGTGTGTAPALKVCQWLTPPVLLDGQYAMAINPIDIGGGAPYTWQEIRRGANSCNEATGTVGTADALADDALAYIDNNKRGASWPNDTHYQLFTIENADPGPIQAPNPPELEFPNNESSISSGTNPYIFAFEDDSGAAGAASWYELFIYDKNNTRISSFESNGTFPNWFKLGVNPEISCTLVGPSALGKRVCVIDALTGGGLAAEIAAPGAYAPNDEFRWWARSYNVHGTSAWSGSGTFVK